MPPSPQGTNTRSRWPDEEELSSAEQEVRTKIGGRLAGLSDIALALVVEAAEAELVKRGSGLASRGQTRSRVRRR